MRPVVLALPRSGSAWLAAYLGYLHDPVTHLDLRLLPPSCGVVDTGAAYNPEKVWRRYGEGPACVLLRNPEEAYASMVKLSNTVSFSDVAEWYNKLYEFGTDNDLPVFWYDDIFSVLPSLEHLCDRMGCEYELTWAKNFKRLRIEHPFSDYTRETWDRYVEWADA